MSKMLIIGAVAVVLGLFVLGGFLLWQMSQQAGPNQVWPTPSSQPTQQTPPPAQSSEVPATPRDQAELDFAGWQTYRSEEFGFEVKLPPHVRPKDNEQNQWWVLIYKNKEDSLPIYAADFIIGFIKNKEMSEYEKELYMQLESLAIDQALRIGDDYSITRRENVKLDGCIASQFLNMTSSADYYSYITYCERQGGRIYLSGLFDDHTPDLELTKEQLERTYNQILSTFQFIE